jgi:hypothetical protein
MAINAPGAGTRSVVPWIVADSSPPPLLGGAGLKFDDLSTGLGSQLR